MKYYAKPLNKLINELARLPGIGERTAQRLALHILSLNDKEAFALSDAIREAKETMKYCSVCGNLTDTDPCAICADTSRDSSTICVVESPKDVLAMEKIREYRGYYHVLHGVYNPVGNMNMNDITLTELFARLTDHPEIKEVIVATNQTAEGNATALYISRLLGSTGIKVTRLASGLPMGSNIENADDITLMSALNGRVNLS